MQQQDNHNDIINQRLLAEQEQTTKEEGEPIKPLEEEFQTCGNGHDDSEGVDLGIGVQGENQQEDDEEEDEGSPSEILLELVSEAGIILFKDQYRIAHASIIIRHNDQSEHTEILKVESNAFKRYLTKLYYDTRHEIIGNESVKNVTQILQARAEYEGEIYPLSLRVAWLDGNIYYDMTNDKWDCIKITPEGWSLEHKTPIPMFTRYSQLPQAYPIREYPADIFVQFLSLTNLKPDKPDDRLLLMVYIVTLFIPDIPHTMLVLHGEKGSAKSTLQTLIKMLVDPAKPRLLTVYNDVKEFIQQLAHNHIAYYDNLKRTPQWLSDEACKAVTGVGSTKRKLYSDDEDIVYEYRRCLGFNGINITLTEPDALDRSLVIELERIITNRQEAEIMEQFHSLRAQLLAYILDTLTRALVIKPTVVLDGLPRMGDFAIWGEAISKAMGFPEMTFINAYDRNRGRQNIEAVESDPLGQAIALFVKEWYNEDTPTCWQGRTSYLLDDLERIANENRIRTDHNSWPRTADALTKRLKIISSSLREGLDIYVIIDKVRSGNGRGLSVTKVWKTPLHASHAYHTTFEHDFSSLFDLQGV